MHIYADYDIYTGQQYHMKNLERRIQGFESGETYQKMKPGQKRQRHYYEQIIARKNKKIAQMHRQGKNNLKMWFEVFGDIQQESDRRASAYEKQLKRAEERVLKAERRAAERHFCQTGSIGSAVCRYDRGPQEWKNEKYCCMHKRERPALFFQGHERG